MLKLTRLNKKGNPVECVIIPENIVGFTEKEMEDVVLYDELGNQVSTQKVDNIFQVRFNDGSHIFVDKTTYDKLVARMPNVETL